METYNQLVLKDRSTLSESENEFLTLHEQILYSGSTASAYFIEFAKNLKNMRDSKLYESAGFETFGSYVEEAVNIKQRQAYKYIEVYEKFTEEFLTRNSKLGITKLLLLSSFTDEEKEVVAKEIIEENLTVEELKKRLEEKEREISQLEIDFKNTNEEKINEANKKVEKTKKALEKALKEKEDLFNEYNDLKNTPAKVEVVENPATLEKLKSISDQLKVKDEEILKLNKQLSLNSNTKLLVFKVKYEALQVHLSDINKLIEEMENEDKAKCKKALKAVMGAYL